jgi:hypothetical protein
MSLRRWSLAGVLSALLVAGAAAAQTPVDTALVLIVDSSGSIDDNEFRLQKEGIAQAVTSVEVLSAIRSAPLRRLAIAYAEWGSPGGAATVVSWHIVDGADTARRFADEVRMAARTTQSYNAIGDAIDHGADMIAACPCQPTRSVIDVSGDGPDMRSLRPARIARDSAVAAGITVNALAILQTDARGPSGKPRLVEHYEHDVIGGPGAFVIVAQTRADFADAMRRKLVLEIAALPGTLRQAVVNDIPR